jgi:formylglycine-generating enzyme required for sulfatase activity
MLPTGVPLGTTPPFLDVSQFSYDDGFAGTAPVGRFLPNKFGLFDMIGNAAEWCQDEYRHDAYTNSSLENPCVLTAEVPGERIIRRVCRGGAWLSPPAFARVAARNKLPANAGIRMVGFRVAITIDADEPHHESE